METKPITSHNLLVYLHSELVQLPKSFRDHVCRECGWSNATFYRKAKGTYPLTNAERDKIISVGDKLLKNISNVNNRFKTR
ncbi:hypothetical protein [Chitinophaga deserti]|uniref:hypothetical protein n=1 Tax=Chitinophaga deserti TaxID=2164099 RepID=UPI000D6BF8D1|nr:hypothetical protein [Chitinophaga deserti]